MRINTGRPRLVKILIDCGSEVKPEMLYTGASPDEALTFLESLKFVRLFEDESGDYPVLIQSSKVVSMAFGKQEDQTETVTT